MAYSARLELSIIFFQVIYNSYSIFPFLSSEFRVTAVICFNLHLIENPYYIATIFILNS